MYAVEGPYTIDVRHVEAIVGTTREWRMATESSGAVATESGRAATTYDATADDETAATGGVMYADEGPYTIDVSHVEEMVETTREAVDADRVRQSQGRDQRQDGGDGW